MLVEGFDWDAGNWPKCGKHGVPREDIEDVLSRNPAVLADTHTGEQRFNAIGQTRQGRYVFIVFALRERDGKTRIRPISARYMHEKEIRKYEQG